MPEDQDGWWETPRAGDGPLSAEDFVVPDDLRELDDEIAAYHRELRADRRRERWARWRPGQPARRQGAAVPLLFCLLVTIGILGSLLVAFLPGGAEPGVDQPPLATGDRTPAGQPGGLLPAATLSVFGTSLPARNLRPAVFLLLPQPCGCTALVDAVAGLAGEYGQQQLHLVIVGRADRDLATLAAGAHEGDVLPAVDTSGALFGTFAVRGATALFVDLAGVVTGIHRGLTVAAVPHLQVALEQLISAGQPGSPPA